MPDQARDARTDINRARRAQLAPEDPQIIITDLQQTLIGNNRTRAAKDITWSVVGLVRVAEQLALLYWFSATARHGTDPTLIEVRQRYAHQDHILERVTATAFMDAPTVRRLAEARRRHLIVAGVASEVFVLQTVLDGLALGYHIHYAVDATGGLSLRGCLQNNAPRCPKDQ